MAAKRILVVDDDRDFAESLGDLLEAEGHEVSLAFNGPDAVSRFETEDFDIAFMDVRMPGMSGVEAFLEIRRKSKGSAGDADDRLQLR